MATLMIRKLDETTTDRFKEIAKEHRRSAEAEARSLVEDYTAGLLVHKEVETTHFYDRLREFMNQEGIKGFEMEVPMRSEAGDPISFE
jgi:plasmid stability protein